MRFYKDLEYNTGEGNGNPLQYSCLENPRDGEASWATVHGVAKSQTRLSDFTSLSLITSDVEHLLVCLLSMRMSSLKKCLRVIPFFFFLPCPLLVGSYFPNQGMNPGYQKLELQILTTGPPGNSLPLFN